MNSADVLKAIRSVAWGATQLPRSTGSRLGVHEAVNAAIASVAPRFGCTGKHEWRRNTMKGRIDVVWFDADGILVAAFETDQSCKRNSLRKLAASGAKLKVIVSYATRPSKYIIPEGMVWLRLGVWKSTSRFRRRSLIDFNSFPSVGVEERRET